MSEPHPVQLFFSREKDGTPLDECSCFGLTTYAVPAVGSTVQLNRTFRDPTLWTEEARELAAELKGKTFVVRRIHHNLRSTDIWLGSHTVDVYIEEVE
jgi:hypothetical protein